LSERTQLAPRSLPMDAFETYREYMFAIAYRMLGSAADAQDVLQEAYLRWQAVTHSDIEFTRAYLSTLVTRLCLDHWRSARIRRQAYVGPWLPEPVHTQPQVDPDSVSLAFLVLLESLTPLERAAYLLHEVFDYSHSEVARILEREEVACRQLLHRARQHVSASKPRFAPSKSEHRRLLEGFCVACASGDVSLIEKMLADDVRAYSDGGGVVTAARKPVRGRRAVARLYLNIFSGRTANTQVSIEDINGLPALLVRVAGQLFSVLDIETDGTHIHALRAIVNPSKLAELRWLS
jgi:RNA polymerase sigma-70 factor (ECF subfamily)